MSLETDEGRTEIGPARLLASQPILLGTRMKRTKEPTTEGKSACEAGGPFAGACGGFAI